VNSEQLLEKLAAQEDALQLAQQLVDWLRQGGSTQAAERFTNFLVLLESRPAIARHLAQQVYAGLEQTHIYPALVTLGIFSRRGFGRELINRLYDRINPPPRDLSNLSDLLAIIFHRADDDLWLQALPDDAWLQLFRILSEFLGAQDKQNLNRHFYREVLYAVEMLSIWVAAEELEPDLMRIDKRLIDDDSSFIALQREMQLLIDSGWKRLEDPEYPLQDTDHLWVMLDQSHDQVARLRRRGAGAGSSVALAHLLERLDQTLTRLESLLGILVKQTSSESSPMAVQLVNQLLLANIEKQGIKPLWTSSTRMLSRSITQNKSDHGEHYIAKDQHSFLALVRSAAGAGIIIALLALLKIGIVNLGLTPGVTALLVSLNYGLGFVLVHLLHFTIATKQPAMTAASFASEVEKGENGRATNRKLAGLLIEVNRSQWAAVWGNVTTAILVAVSLSWLVTWLLKQPLLGSDQVGYQLAALSPITGLALFYAAIAGVWLFFSGIIAGFFDNRADYLEMRERLRYHPLMMRLFNEKRRSQIADYLHDNYGALAGNFFFGLLLGMTGYIGYLTGLPLDIRHVAFSSANLGYAGVSGSLGLLEWLYYLLLVLLIGFVNLWVSFALALSVALRARNTQISRFRDLFAKLLEEIRQRPLMLFFPSVRVLPDKKQDQN
jgi:site-specific recombinase